MFALVATRHSSQKFYSSRGFALIHIFTIFSPKSMHPQYTTAEEAVSVLASGQRVFIHSVAAAPQRLIAAMTARAKELRGVEIVHLHTEGTALYSAPGMEEHFRINALFVGPNLRKAVEEGRADYIPVFLSEAPLLFRRGILPLDVAMIQVSPPNKQGYCSLGVSVDISRAAVECAKLIIAQINPQMPHTHGDGFIHISKIHAAVEVDEPLPTIEIPPHTEVETAIGKYCASLVEDGATLQMGIGAIPDAVLSMLGNHKGLGIHTEMFADGVIPLVEKGVITGEHKATHPGK